VFAPQMSGFPTMLQENQQQKKKLFEVFHMYKFYTFIVKIKG